MPDHIHHPHPPPTPHPPPPPFDAVQEIAIQVAQDAIAANNTEQEIASAIKQKFEGFYPTV